MPLKLESRDEDPTAVVGDRAGVDEGVPRGVVGEVLAHPRGEHLERDLEVGAGRDLLRAVQQDVASVCARAQDEVGVTGLPRTHRDTRGDHATKAGDNP